MELTLTDITETRKDIVVSLTGDEIANEEKTILKQLSKSARIPGFRPGKAPEAMLRKKHGKQLQEELNRSLIQKVYQEVYEKSGVEVSSIVEFPEPDDFKAGTESSLTITIDINPTFDLPEYKGIEVEAPSTEVSDSEIDGMIDNIRRQRADFQLVEKAAEQGDYIKLSYSGKVGDQSTEEIVAESPRLRSWGKVEESWEEAGTDEAKGFGVPAIIDGLIGMAAGDKKEVEQIIPDDFEIEAFRGKTATYEVEVHEVRERKLPEIDEAFLKSVQSETLEDFKAQIMDHLENQKKQQAEEAQRNQILEKLATSVEFPLPESAIDAETQNVMGRIMSQNMQNGVPEEEFEKNKEALHAQSSQTATREVKLQILLGRIAAAEEIKVENEDLSRAVYGMAMQSRRDPKDLANELRKDRRQLMSLQRQVLFSKTLDLLLKSAKVSKQEAIKEN